MHVTDVKWLKYHCVSIRIAFVIGTVRIILLVSSEQVMQ